MGLIFMVVRDRERGCRCVMMRRDDGEQQASKRVDVVIKRIDEVWWGGR